MYILKNAILSIKRNKGRNFLIGLIVVVISIAVTVTLAINNSATKLIKSYSEKYEVEASIGLNRENMIKNFDPTNKDSSETNLKESFSGASELTRDEIESYGDSEYVKSFYYTISTGVNGKNIEAVSMDFMNNENRDSNSLNGSSSATTKEGSNETGESVKGFFGGGRMGFTNASSGDFTLEGYSSIDGMSNFIDGTYKICDGEVFSNFSGSDCIINSELSTTNGINVGDTIEILDSENEDLTYELNVVGIYEEATNSENVMSMFSNSANKIITNSSFVEKMGEANSELKTTTAPTFILINKDIIDDFEDELRDKGLDDNQSVTTNIEEVENATSTIKNLKTFAKTFLIITLVIGSIVLFVINMINIRERKYEIGVLRTIGMKKAKVALQFMSEILIVTFIALIIGGSIGSISSVPIGNMMIESEVKEQESSQNSVMENFGKFDKMVMPDQFNDEFSLGKISGINNIERVNEIRTAVDLKVLSELLLIGIVLVIISGLSAMIAIQRFSPLKILKERS